MYIMNTVYMYCTYIRSIGESAPTTYIEGCTVRTEFGGSLECLSELQERCSEQVDHPDRGAARVVGAEGYGADTL